MVTKRHSTLSLGVSADDPKGSAQSKESPVSHDRAYAMWLTWRAVSGAPRHVHHSDGPAVEAFARALDLVEGGLDATIYLPEEQRFDRLAEIADSVGLSADELASINSWWWTVGRRTVQSYQGDAS